jgi:hypothetical protein
VIEIELPFDCGLKREINHPETNSDNKSQHLLGLWGETFVLNEIVANGYFATIAAGDGSREDIYWTINNRSVRVQVKTISKASTHGTGKDPRYGFSTDLYPGEMDVCAFAARDVSCVAYMLGYEFSSHVSFGKVGDLRPKYNGQKYIGNINQFPITRIITMINEGKI